MPFERKILLSFDVEEFDLPLEYHNAISTEEQLQVGYNGLTEVLATVDAHNVSTTLFVTGFFAQHFPEKISIAAQKHEIASHAFYHSSFVAADLLKSKEVLESITGKRITGFRMPRMSNICTRALLQAGYLYDSSVHPTWIPGRYNNIRASRTPVLNEGLWQVPVSVTPRLRIPLFWLAFKNFPYYFFLRLVRHTLYHDGFVNLYFHPWEFVNLSGYNIPFYLKRGSDKVLLQQLCRLLRDLSKEGDFIKMNEFVDKQVEYTSQNDFKVFEKSL